MPLGTKATARQIHRQAMDLAEEAFSLQRQGDVGQACQKFALAFQLEAWASCYFLEDPDTTTRGVLMKSAAALASNSDNPMAALSFARHALNSNPPDDVAIELRQLLANAEERIRVLPNTAVSDYFIFIGGDWFLGDFSIFFKNLRKLYAVCHHIQHQANVNTASSHPFRGGFSYKNLYDEVCQRIPEGQEPVVQSVQFASPGWIQIQSGASVGAQVQQILSTIQATYETRLSAYNNAYQAFSKAKLLGDDVKQVGKAHVSVVEYAQHQIERAINPMTLAPFRAWGRNEIVATKLAFSFFRTIQQVLVPKAGARVDP